MKKTAVTLSIATLSLSLFSFAEVHRPTFHECDKDENTIAQLQQPFIENMALATLFQPTTVYDLHLKELQQEVDLGFDPAPYLPDGFDAHAGMAKDPTVAFVDALLGDGSTDEVDLGFDTAPYLPEGFDAYAGMAKDPTLAYLDALLQDGATEEVDLGFDTAPYLPEGFDAHAGMAKDPTVIFIDALLRDGTKDEVDLGFDPAPYLPDGFDAYAK